MQEKEIKLMHNTLATMASACFKLNSWNVVIHVVDFKCNSSS